ncbi:MULTISPECIES: DUF4878 domain-containing protein [Bacteroides]|jgi:hypothetical protein|uniref:DUF4878 domain-containing protein n=1 Tax=Bacteroides TaxID=816 RepID=UPI000C793DE6|nr:MULTISPECIES: DUF4878 domain-containing protein [Bacteroides]RGM45247.1 DUF4878 domain-containing protein [Bacteroides sp. OM08-11]
MKKVLYFSLVLTVMLAMVSCSSSTNSPGAAMKEYSKYLQKGDYVKFVDGLAFDDKQTPEQIKEQKEGLASMIKEKGMKEYEKKGGIKDIEILSETISEDGNTAVVKTKTTFGNGETEEGDQKMVKKDGKWLMSLGK